MCSRRNNIGATGRNTEKLRSVRATGFRGILALQAKKLLVEFPAASQMKREIRYPDLEAVVRRRYVHVQVRRGVKRDKAI